MTDNNSTEETQRYVIDRDGDLWRTLGNGSWECLTTDSCLVHGADLVNVCGPLIELVDAAAVRADERTRIATEVEAESREEVGWLAKHASDDIDRARLIGAVDAYKAALRVIGESAGAPPVGAVLDPVEPGTE